MDIVTLRNWFGFFLLGSINNLPYVIVTSAASTIADSFGENNQIGLVFYANVALSVFAKSLNAFALLKISYWKRFVANTVLMLVGLFGVAYAGNFWFALGCILLVGCSAAFGENVALGYLHIFPSKMVNAWSSGTGAAGVIGSGVYIIFGCVVGAGGSNESKMQTLTKFAFLLTTPAVVIYLLAFIFIIKHPPKTEEAPRHSVQSSTYDERKPLLNQTSEEVFGVHSVQEETYRERLRRCTKLVLWMAFNICTVYMFEYVAQGCAAKVRPKSEYNIGCPELYAALSFCYQAGVFVSRSSVQLLQIKRVEILTALQFINMLLWIFDVHFKFIPVYLLPALMIYVGLLGGASYVNIFYLLLNDEKYPDEDRELCINITALFVNLGIVLGTGLETALFNTALKND